MPPKRKTTARRPPAPRRPPLRAAPQPAQPTVPRRQQTTMQRQAALRQKAWQTRPVRRGVNPGQQTQTPRQAARSARRGLAKVTTRKGRYSAAGMLTAELLVGAGIVAMRMISDYEPQQDGTLKGKIGHPKGQYGPLPILAGLLATFFLLSFLAARGGTKAKVAVVAGGLIDLVLAMKSVSEIEKTATTFSSFGKAKMPPGEWETSGYIAGDVLGGSGGSSNVSIGKGNAERLGQGIGGPGVGEEKNPPPGPPTGPPEPM